MIRTEMAVEAFAVLEENATALSVPLLTDEELARARAMNAEMAQCAISGQVERYGVLGHELHELLYSRCPNARLLELVRSHAAAIRAVAEVHPVFNREAALITVREHDLLLDQLEAHDISPQEVATCARVHRLRTLRTVLDDLMTRLEDLLVDDLNSLPAT